MNKREVVKSLLENAKASVSEITAKEIHNLLILAREARYEEWDAEYKIYHNLTKELEKTEEFKTAISEIRLAEVSLQDLRDKYEPELKKKSDQSFDELNNFWKGLIWEIEVMETRKQQTLRDKRAVKGKKSGKRSN